MNLISDIPCKNCITFAVCNAQISNDFPCSNVRFKLIPKCSLIKEYIVFQNYCYPLNPFIKVAKFFKPYKSFVDYRNLGTGPENGRSILEY